jgi:cathepsin X
VADRINIARNRSWPDLSLAPQVIINCKYGGSGCDGGNPGHIYMYAREVGLPEESCQAYTAKNPAEFLCSNEQICHKCNVNGCFPQKKYTVWKVVEHGLVEGAARMKAEIYARGPITCGIDATNRWEDYSGGIYSESKLILD